MKNYEIEKSKVHNLLDVVDYAPATASSVALLSKLTGTVRVSAHNINEVINGAAAAFDTFIFVMEGRAGITIDEKLSTVKAGQGMIIPAHRPNSIRAIQRFKMIIAIIKSGYEPA